MKTYYQPYYGKIKPNTLMCCHDCGWIGEKKHVSGEHDFHFCPKCMRINIIPVEKVYKPGFLLWNMGVSLILFIIFGIFVFIFDPDKWIFLCILMTLDFGISSIVFNSKNK